MKVSVETYDNAGNVIDTWEVEVAETEPSLSTHVSQLVGIDTSKVRPAQIKRVWEERDYFYDCFVTETIKEMYLAGNIQPDDWVLVHFDDIGEQLVTEKIYKSW